jgi:hypothetical protein
MECGKPLHNSIEVSTTTNLRSVKKGKVPLTIWIEPPDRELLTAKAKDLAIDPHIYARHLLVRTLQIESGPCSWPRLIGKGEREQVGPG